MRLLTGGRWGMKALPVWAAMALLSACAAPTDAGDEGDSPSVSVTHAISTPAGDDYSFELTQTCGEQAVTGRFLVSVEDGQVSDVVGLDLQGMASAKAGAEEYIPTLEALPEAIAQANARGGSAKATYDKATGELATVDMDLGPGIDDETCYVITDVKR